MITIIDNISNLCPWCVEVRLVFACQTFLTPPCTTRRARNASTSPSEPESMTHMPRKSDIIIIIIIYHYQYHYVSICCCFFTRILLNIILNQFGTNIESQIKS